MAAELSKRCFRFKDMEFPLLYYMNRYLVDKYDKNNNPQGIINMGTSENKIIADVVAAKMNECSEFLEEHSHYGDFRGIANFREALAKFFIRYMKPLENIDPNNICVYNGGASIIKGLSSAIFNPGEAILIPAPFYGGFDQDLFIENEIIRIPVHFSGEPHPETGLPFEFTLEGLEKALAAAKEQNITVRGLLLCHPNNPLGTIYSEKQILECMEFAERHKLHLISDEIYMLSIFKEGASMKSALAVKGPIHPDRLHIIWGFSKDFGVSGVRCAAVYSRNQNIIAALENIAIFYAVSKHLQAMLQNLISDYDWLDNVFMPTNQKRLRECHRVVTEVLEKHNIPVMPASAGLYIWIDLRKYLPSLSFEAEKNLADLLLENKVYINAGQVFSCGEPGWFRIVFASDPEMIRIGIGRVVETLQKLKDEVAKCKL